MRQALIPAVALIISCSAGTPHTECDTCAPAGTCDVQVPEAPDVHLSCPADLTCETTFCPPGEVCPQRECPHCADVTETTCPSAVCDVADVSCPAHECDVQHDCFACEFDAGPLCPSPCGNGHCEDGESAEGCPVDCGPCGDGVCGHHEVGPAGGTCPADCLAACGNGQCEGGESPQFCLVDCSGCGDGFCGFMESSEVCLGDCPPACGNGTCDPGEGVLECAVDCFPPCGDALCTNGENPYSCPVDCTVCGDGVCGADETKENCAFDCDTPCGNGVCDGLETDVSCPVDCGPCGDDVCGHAESHDSCLVDCHGCAGKECGDDGFGGSCGLCDDDDACTTDNCQDSQCQFENDPLLCDDGNDCTDDSCDPIDGCLFAPLDGSTCDDGNPCTIGGLCDGTICQGLAWNPCDDLNICTDDSCEPPDGCLNAPNIQPCNDNNVCTTIDVCADSACTGSAPLDCDDAQECTEDSCDPVTGCLNDLVADGTPCGAPGDICFSGTCCTPDCEGLNCGSDGCGGTCGSCLQDNLCASGACFSTLCGAGCDLNETFDSWDPLTWEGNSWCNDIDQGAWEPAIVDGEAAMVGTDECWSQIRTVATWGAFSGLKVFVTPNLSSGGAGTDEAYVAYGNGWVQYAGNSAGFYLSDGKIWTWRSSVGLETEIGTYTPGEMVVLEINWHGTALTLRINGAGPYNVTLFEAAGQNHHLIMAQKNSEDGMLIEAAIEY